MNELMSFFLTIILGCVTVFMVVFTFWLLYAFIPFLFEIVQGLWRYASGKFKDNE